MLAKERAHDRLAEFAVTDSVTTPVKPFTGATVIVEVPTIPWTTFTVAGLAEIVKSAAPVR